MIEGKAAFHFLLAALLAALCAQLIGAPPLEAEETIESKGEALSLSNCVDLALRHAFSIRIADEKVMAAGERKGEAFLGFLPEVTSGVSWNGDYYRLNKESDYFKGYALATDSETDPAEDEKPESDEWSDSYYWWFRLQEPLLDAGRWIDYFEAGENLEKEEVDRRRAERDLVHSVAKAFYTMMKARRSLAVAREDLARKQETLDRVRASVDLGKKPQYEILGAEVDVGQARQILIEKENQKRISRVELATLLGIPIGDDIRFVEPGLGPAVVPGALGELTGQAFTARPEVRVREHSKRLQELALSQTRWDWAPELYLTGSYQRYLGIGPQDIQEEAWGVGLTLSVPLVDTVATAKRTAAARHSLRQSRLELEEQKQQIALEVERAFHNLETAREALDLSEKQVASARENFESARERYALEISSRYELSEAQADLAKAELEQVKTYYDLRLAEAELAYQTGEPIRVD